MGTPSDTSRLEEGPPPAADSAAGSETPARPEVYVDPVIEAYKPGVDITLLWHMRQMTVEQRLVTLENTLRDCVELRRAGKKAFGR